MYPPSQPPNQASIAFSDIAEPHYADAILVKVPGGKPLPEDPAWWTNQIFSVRSAPIWIQALLALRQAVVGLIGINRAPSSVFEIDRVENGEALISEDDTHLDFRTALRVHTESRVLQLTTVVRLHGWRGRLYWSVVSLFHGPVTRSMMKRAARNFAGSD